MRFYLIVSKPFDYDSELESIIKARMPKRKLIDILVNVNHYTGWATVFGPLSGSDPKIHNAVERYILTTFAYGTGMGPTQAAQHMRLMYQHICYPGQISGMSRQLCKIKRWLRLSTVINYLLSQKIGGPENALALMVLCEKSIRKI